jgi:structure-specific recognition protein 1
MTVSAGALSAYIIFTQAERAKVLSENPGMGATDVLKEMGVRWSKMTAADKQPFEERARADKER